MRFRLPAFETLLVAAVLVANPASAGNDNRARTERVGWARLKTPSPEWKRHSRSDPVLMRFLSDATSLNIDPTWYEADIQDLDKLCQFPLVFSQGIGMVHDPQSRTNLAEYLRRGGFLLIDCCINKAITPDPDSFIADQARVLTDILPGVRVRELPKTHPIYHCFFDIPGGRPPHTYHDAIFNPRFARHGLVGIEFNNRMVGLISVSGLQCGWDRMVAPNGHDVTCMQMLLNIYIHAMTQGP